MDPEPHVAVEAQIRLPGANVIVLCMKRLIIIHACLEIET